MGGRGYSRGRRLGLWRIRPGHATMTVDSVQLVDVLFRSISPEGYPAGEGEAWDLSWDHVASIPLRNPPS